MAKKLVIKEPPVGIEHAAKAFAKACERDGWDGCVVLTCGAGRVDMLNGGDEVYMYQDGDWFVHRGVGA